MGTVLKIMCKECGWKCIVAPSGETAPFPLQECMKCHAPATALYTIDMWEDPFLDFTILDEQGEPLF